MAETSGRFQGRTGGGGAGLFTRKKTVAFLTVYLALYLATWVGGWRSHAQYLKDRAEAGYRYMQERSREEEAEALRTGTENEHFTDLYMHKDGPKYGVDWCVPVVPGVLVANSYRSVGPLDGCGGIKIVFYCGFGSREFCLLCWLA
jgi:hypothetical protein